MDELSALLEGMNPGELEQLLQLGGLAEQSGDIQAQLEALRNRGPRPQVDFGGSAAGAAMAGIGDIFRGIHGKVEESALKKEQAGLRAEQTKGRSLLAQLLARRGKGVLPPSMDHQPVAQGPDQMLAAGRAFGLGGKY